MIKVSVVDDDHFPYLVSADPGHEESIYDEDQFSRLDDAVHYAEKWAAELGTSTDFSSLSPLESYLKGKMP